jgi:hypothetical protein
MNISKLESLKFIAEATTVLEWLIIGFLFSLIHVEMTIALFIVFGIGLVSKILLVKEERKIEAIIISELHDKIMLQQKEEIDKSED